MRSSSDAIFCSEVLLFDRVQARFQSNKRTASQRRAIEAEEARERAAQNESSIKAFFEKYAHADFDDPSTRDTVLDYFIDRIYLYDDGHFKVTGWYWDFAHEINVGIFDDLPERASGFEYSLDLDPSGFVRFADGDTIANELSVTGSFLLGRIR